MDSKEHKVKKLTFNTVMRAVLSFVYSEQKYLLKYGLSKEIIRCLQEFWSAHK
jgi:hypothetical protein